MILKFEKNKIIIHPDKDEQIRVTETHNGGFFIEGTPITTKAKMVLVNSKPKIKHTKIRPASNITV